LLSQAVQHAQDELDAAAALAALRMDIPALQLDDPDSNTFGTSSVEIDDDDVLHM